MKQPKVPLRWRILSLSVLAGIVMVPAGLAGTAQAAYSGNDGRIAFVRGGDIYTITPGGSGLHRLTANGHSSGPRWSPTGRRIAYLRNGNLWIMNADGTHQAQVTNAAPASTDARPTWSPNGRYLAFVKTAKGQSSGYLTRYDTVGGAFRTFVTSAESGALRVRALPTAVAWQFTAEGDSALVYEGADRTLCPSQFRFCLAAVTYPSQSIYQGGDPSLEYAHSNSTRFRDPDWYPNRPPFATGLLASVVKCPAGSSCTHLGIQPSLAFPLPAMVLPGAYQAVFAPTGTQIAYVKNVTGTPTIFTTASTSTRPPRPGTKLTTGTEPDWQPVPRPADR
jgi:hypothetical protein